MLQDLELAIRVNTGALQEAVEAMTRLEEKFTNASKRATKSLQGMEKGQKRVSNATKEQGRVTDKTAKSTKQFTQQSQNLTKSVQVALGPLSGIAARITALTALFNRNAAVLATFLAGLTAFTVAMGRAVTAGQLFEQEMLRVDAVLEATGRQAFISSEEINEMGRRIGEATMTSASMARNAAAQLATFRNIATSSFEEAITAAQGLSASMGGNLQSNIRRIGRVLDDPIRNLNALNRAGVQFTQQEERKITSLVRSNRLLEAQGIILQRLSAFTRLAEEESRGLAGRFDTLREKINAVLEESAITSTLLDTMTEIMDRLNERLENLLDPKNEGAVRELGEAFATFAAGLGQALLFLVNNVEKIAALIGGYLTASILLKAWPAFKALTSAAITLTLSLIAAATATEKFATAQILLGTATRKSTLTLGALFSTLGFVILTLTSAIAAYQFFSRRASESTSQLSQQEQQVDRTTRSLKELIKVTSGAEKGALLQLSVRISSVSLELRNLQNELEQQQELRRLGQEGFDLGRIEELEEKIKNLTEELNNLNKEAKKAREEVENLDIQGNQSSNSLLELAQKYNRTAFEIAEFKEDQESLNKQIDFFNSILDGSPDRVRKLAKSLGFVGGTLQEAKDFVKEYIKGIEEGMREADPRRMTEDIDREFERLKITFRDVNDEITTLQAQLAGDPLDFDFSDLRQIEQLTRSSLIQIAEMEGVAVDAAMSTRDIQLEVARALRERRNEAERLKEAEADLQEVEQFISENISEGTDLQQQEQQLVEEFDRMKAIIRDAYGEQGDARIEQLRRIKERELREMRDSAAGIDEIRRMEIENMSQVDQVRIAFEERREEINEAYADEYELREYWLEKLNELEKREKKRAQEAEEEMERQRQNALMGAMGDIFGNVADVMRAGLGEQHSLYKRFAQAQALMAGAVAFNNALATQPTQLGMALAATVAAATGAQLAQIEAQNFATGGMVRGPGGPRSDSIPAMLSNGEFVMSASAVRNIGAHNLAMMNMGQQPTFARGGMVGNTNSTGNLTNIEIIDQRSSGADIETISSTDPDGTRRTKLLIRDVVRESVANGDLDREMNITYGVRRRGSQR